jgi:hypothetical protein
MSRILTVTGVVLSLFMLGAQGPGTSSRVLAAEQVGGTISGVLFDEGGAAPVSSGVAEIYDSEFILVDRQLASAGGGYESVLLPPGDYYVLLYNGDEQFFINYFPQWYGGAPLLRPDRSTPVTVDDVDVSGIGASLDPLFQDMFDTVFTDDIGFLHDSDITRGCNPPVNDLFCPDDFVTRGQMAAFLVRALGYIDDGGGDLFDDDDDSVFEGDIDRLGTAGVTRGCNPPVNDLFCPDDFVTRGQMAAFLHRALDVYFPVFPIAATSQVADTESGTPIPIGDRLDRTFGARR